MGVMRVDPVHVFTTVEDVGYISNKVQGNRFCDQVNLALVGTIQRQSIMF